MEGAIPSTRHKLFEVCSQTWKSILKRFEEVTFNLDSPEIVKTEERRLALEVLIGGLLLNPSMVLLVDPRKMIESICNTALCQENIFDTQSYKIVEAIYAYIVAIKLSDDFVGAGNDCDFDLKSTRQSFKRLEVLLEGSPQVRGNEPKVLKSIIGCVSSPEPVLG